MVINLGFNSLLSVVLIGRLNNFYFCRLKWVKLDVQIYQKLDKKLYKNSSWPARRRPPVARELFLYSFSMNFLVLNIF